MLPLEFAIGVMHLVEAGAAVDDDVRITGSGRAVGLPAGTGHLYRGPIASSPNGIPNIAIGVAITVVHLAAIDDDGRIAGGDRSAGDLPVSTSYLRRDPITSGPLYIPNVAVRVAKAVVQLIKTDTTVDDDCQIADSDLAVSGQRRHILNAPTASAQNRILNVEILVVIAAMYLVKAGAAVDDDS